MNQKIKDKFVELANYGFSNSSGSRCAIELLFMVEEAIPTTETETYTNTVKIYIGGTCEAIPKALYQEIQCFLDDGQHVKAIKALWVYDKDHSAFGLKASRDATHNVEGHNWDRTKMDVRLRDEPEDIEPDGPDVLSYDPMGVGDDSDPQDTVNADPDAKPIPYFDGQGDSIDVAMGMPLGVSVDEDAEEGEIKQCCDCGRVLIFDEKIRCNICRDTQ